MILVIKSRFQQKINKYNAINQALMITKPLTMKVKTKKSRKFPVIPNISSFCVKLTSQI